MSEPNSPLRRDPLRVRTRVPVTPGAPFGGGLKRGAVLLYAVLALGLACVALYMSLGLRHPLISAYVMGPAVGAAWFGLRLFMIIAPKG